VEDQGSGKMPGECSGKNGGPRDGIGGETGAGNVVREDSQLLACVARASSGTCSGTWEGGEEPTTQRSQPRLEHLGKICMTAQSNHVGCCDVPCSIPKTFGLAGNRGGGLWTGVPGYLTPIIPL
jgi:hypothetical protein